MVHGVQSRRVCLKLLLLIRPAAPRVIHECRAGREARGLARSGVHAVARIGLRPVRRGPPAPPPSCLAPRMGRDVVPRMGVLWARRGILAGAGDSHGPHGPPAPARPTPRARAVRAWGGLGLGTGPPYREACAGAQ